MKKTFIAFALCGLAVTTSAIAQSVISAKAGVIHYIEGSAAINEQPIVIRPSLFPELKNKEVLRTDEGRVEMLLAPGSVLRLSERSAVRMESNSILNTKLTMLEGTALIEVSELPKETSIEFKMGEDVVSVRKAGLYRLEMDSPNVKVYSGEVAINSNDELRKLSEGKSMTLTGDHLISKFEKKNTDELVQWADRRSGILALANIASARTLSNNGSSYASSGSGLGRSSWFYNSYFGMYTFVPYSGLLYSPFGYSYYSPRTVFNVYVPPQNGYSAGGGGAGYGGVDRSHASFNNDLGYNSSVQRSATGYSGISAPVSAGPAAGGGGARGAGGGAGGGASAGRGGGTTGGRGQ